MILVSSNIEGRHSISGDPTVNLQKPLRPPSNHRSPLRSVPEIDGELLIGSDRRVSIRHRGRTYELRETRGGRLVLER